MKLESETKTNDDFLKQLLKTNQLWIKHSGEGKNSLMRALSNAVYFTEVYHSIIQKIIQSFVCQNMSLVADTLNLPHSYLQSFLDDPSLPEYESLNLEIAACIFDSRIKLYYTSEMSLCSDLFYRKTKSTIKILRIYDNHYAAVFPSKLREILPEAQNIVLSIVTSVLENGPLELTDFNEGKFINFEFQDWLRNSSHQTHRNSGLKDTFSIGGNSGSYYKQSFHSFDSFNPRSAEESYLGDEILSIFQNRKCTSKNASIKFLETKYDDLINSITKYHEEDRSIGGVNDTPIGNWERKEACVINEFVQEKEADLRHDTMFEFEIDLQEIKMPCLQQSKMLSIFDECFYEPMPSTSLKSRGPNEQANNPEKLVNGQENLPIHVRDEPSTLKIDLKSLGNNLHQENDEFASCRRLKDQSDAKTVLVEDSPNKKLTLRERMQKKIQQLSPTQQSLAEQEYDYSDPASNLFLQQMMFNWPGMPQDIDPAFFIEQFAMYNEKTHNKARRVNNQPIDSQNKGLISKELYEGKLKFFDEKNNFGFITADIKGTTEDIFIYGSEFEEAKINMDLVRSAKYGHIVMFKFNVAAYFGKYKRSKKAVNLQLSL